MTNNVTPYDTGKVKIGLYYQIKPLPTNIMDGDVDGDLLQEALLLRKHSSWMSTVMRMVRKVVRV